MTEEQNTPQKAKKISIKIWALIFFILSSVFSIGVLAFLYGGATEELNATKTEVQQITAEKQQLTDELEEKYQYWAEDEQADAIAIASGTISSYMADPGLSLMTWRSILSEKGTADFKDWVDSADPSFRPRGHILTVREANFTSDEATVWVITSGGGYQVTLQKSGDEILVDSLAVKGG